MKEEDEMQNVIPSSPKRPKHTHKRRASLTSSPVKTKPVCAHCNKPIKTERLEAMGNTYHPDHFMCKQCGKGMNDYYVLEDDALCKRCYQERTCDKCAHCGKPITDDKLVAMNKSWHAKHFCCCICSKPFGQETPFCEKDGKAYCEKDFNEAFMPKCARCNEAIIDGSCISALGKKWHPEHFSCTVCKGPIDVGSPVYVRQGKPYCAKDCPSGEDGVDQIVAPATNFSSRMKRSLSFTKSNKVGRERSQSSPLGRIRTNSGNSPLNRLKKNKGDKIEKDKDKEKDKEKDKSGEKDKKRGILDFAKREKKQAPANGALLKRFGKKGKKDEDSGDEDSDEEWIQFWDNSAEFARPKWPEAREPDDGKPLVLESPGYHRELGGEVQEEQDLDDFPLPTTTLWYKEYLHNQPGVEHYIVYDDPNRPTIITLEGKRPKKKKDKEYILRAIIRTVRGDERILLKCCSDSKGARQKALKQAYPQLADAKLIEIKEPEGENKSSLGEALVVYEHRMFSNCYKMGVLYCKSSQTGENDMYNNTSGSTEFDEFLDLMGKRVVLKGFDKFRGGLNVTDDLTGSHSIYSEFFGFEVMFHISTMIPFTAEDIQQVERKRHLGNDVVLIVFRDSDCDITFDPSGINSQYNHVFCVIQPLDDSHYKVAFSCKQGVHPSEPFLPRPAIFPKDEKFHNWLLSKLINAEYSAMQAQQFSIPLRRTRRQLLQEIVHQFLPS